MEGREVSEVAVDPLTEDQLAAIRECRFSFINVSHTIAWAYTMDAALAARCPGSVMPVTRAREPVLVEYEIQMGHPQALGLVMQIQDERAAA
jgi:hypothetical protein